MNDNGLNGSTRAFKGLWIPAAIFNDSKLCWTDKILWSIIDSFTGERGCCFATNAWFSARLGIGARGVQKALERLKIAGLLLTYDDGNDRRQLVAVASNVSASSSRANSSSGEDELAFAGGDETEFAHNKKILKQNIYTINPPTPFGGCPPYGEDPHLGDEGERLNPPMPSDEGERLSAEGGAQAAEMPSPPTPSPSVKRFRKPTAEEVRAYAESRGESIEAERFCDFYASKGWRVGKSAMKDWRAAVRNWLARSRSEGGAAQAGIRERRGADDVLAHNLQIRDKLCGGYTFGAVFGGGAEEVGEGER